MPVGNGRSSANVFVESTTGDLVLTLGLADALDENSNLLKLGIVRVRFDPPLNPSGPFNQTLVLSAATIDLNVSLGSGSAAIAVWVDATTSDIRIRVKPTPGSPVRIFAILDHAHRLDGVIDAGGFGNGWGGSGGSFCNPNGTIADFVGIYPDKLMQEVPDAVAWYHRNDPARADFYGDAMKQQGLAGCGARCWDPLTNRSFGAVLVGASDFHKVNATVLGTPTAVSLPAELAVSVVSAQTDTAEEFETLLLSEVRDIAFPGANKQLARR